MVIEVIEDRCMSIPVTIEDDDDDEQEVPAGQQCVICHEWVWKVNEEGSGPVVTPCGHVFHSSCVHSSLAVNYNCPLCKQTLNATEFRELAFETRHVAPQRVEEMMQLRSMCQCRESRVAMLEELRENAKATDAELLADEKEDEELQTSAKDHKRRRPAMIKQGKASEEEENELLSERNFLTIKCSELQASKDSLTSQSSKKLPVRQALENDLDVKAKRKLLQVMDLKVCCKQDSDRLTFELRQENAKRARYIELDKTKTQLSAEVQQEMQESKRKHQATINSKDAAAKAKNSAAAHGAAQPAKASRTKQPVSAESAAAAVEADEDKLLFGAFSVSGTKRKKPCSSSGGGLLSAGGAPRNGGSSKAAATGGLLFGGAGGVKGVTSQASTRGNGSSILRTRLSERGA